MEYKEIYLVSQDIASAMNEIKFEIATARAEGSELVIIRYSSDNGLLRFPSKVSYWLRRMKQKRAIQLYATTDNFARAGTESVYLKNKYPMLFGEDLPTDERVIYIKL